MSELLHCTQGHIWPRSEVVAVAGGQRLCPICGASAVVEAGGETVEFDPRPLKGGDSVGSTLPDRASIPKQVPLAAPEETVAVAPAPSSGVADPATLEFG